MTEYIYLLQTREFIKTNENIYKIGKTKQKNLKRICNYDNGTILICQFKCIDCDKLEKSLIALFRDKYELQKDIGNEYFKGNCHDMRDDIYNYIKNENIIKDDEECSIKDDHENIYDYYPNEEQLNEIKENFPCYKDDECFGGKKKLVKFCIEENIHGTILSVYFINDKFLDDIERNISSEDESKYYNKLINKKIIIKNKIYDMNNKLFINKLIKSKIKISIQSENINDIIEKYNLYKDRWPKFAYIVDNIILNNCIVNDVIYCDYINNILYVEFIIPCYNDIKPWSHETIKKEIRIIKINDKIYDYALLRKYTPYCMELKDDEYYFYNRDYQIIDKNEKKYYIENWNGSKRIYFDGEIGLIFNKDKNEFKNYIERINNIILNKSCMNMNENTQFILNLYK